MVLLAWRASTNPMAINNVRCPDDYSQENGKNNMQQLAEMAFVPLLSNVGLYGNKTKLQLQFTALKVELKVTKAQKATTIQTSSDDCVCKRE